MSEAISGVWLWYPHVAALVRATCLNVCASGQTVAQAQARAYAAVDRIKWPDGFCRRDIGWQAVERERQ